MDRSSAACPARRARRSHAHSGTAGRVDDPFLASRVTASSYAVPEIRAGNLNIRVRSPASGLVMKPWPAPGQFLTSWGTSNSVNRPGRPSTTPSGTVPQRASAFGFAGASPHQTRPDQALTKGPNDVSLVRLPVSRLQMLLPPDDLQACREPLLPARVLPLRTRVTDPHQQPPWPCCDCSIPCAAASSPRSRVSPSRIRLFAVPSGISSSCATSL